MDAEPAEAVQRSQGQQDGTAQRQRAIDQARDEFAKQESFCQAMAWVSRDQGRDPRFQPRTGEIHDFTPAVDPALKSPPIYYFFQSS